MYAIVEGLVTANTSYKNKDGFNVEQVEVAIGKSIISINSGNIPEGKKVFLVGDLQITRDGRPYFREVSIHHNIKQLSIYELLPPPNAGTDK